MGTPRLLFFEEDLYWPNFLLSTAFAASYRFWKIVFSVSFVWRYFLFFSLISSWAHLCMCVCVFYFIYFFRAHGIGPARGQIRAAAAGLCHSHLGSLIHRARPGIAPVASWILVRFVSTEPLQEPPRWLVGLFF